MNSICKRMVRDIVRRRRRKGQMQVFSQAARSSRDRLILSESDYHRLLDLVSRELRSGRIKKRRLTKLRQMVRRAEVRPLYRVPPEVITMNSVIALSTRDIRFVRVRLVYPADADKSEGRLSITSQAGMCLIGKKAGDRLRRNVLIEKIIYQPEANDDFHL